MGRLGELMSEPLMSETDEAQRKSLVTYRLSLVQPPQHIKILENRSLVAAGGTTGLRTWEAALHLGQYLSINGHLIAGRRVLELGAGTGYLSILCAKTLGAAHVTSTDGSEDVVETLGDNFSLNGLEWDYNVSSSARLRPKLLKWGHALVGTEEPEWNGGQKVDLVIGADVTYDQTVIPFLVSTLNELVELDPDTEILISATQRNPHTLTVFRDSCAKAHLQVNEVELSVKDQEDALKHHGQPGITLTPFYSTQVPIYIFHIYRS
jgi:protein-lysine N-methyltransferase EEF2KMT